MSVKRPAFRPNLSHLGQYHLPGTVYRSKVKTYRPKGIHFGQESSISAKNLPSWPNVTHLGSNVRTHLGQKLPTVSRPEITHLSQNVHYTPRPKVTRPGPNTKDPIFTKRGDARFLLNLPTWYVAHSTTSSAPPLLDHHGIGHYPSHTEKATNHTWTLCC